MSLYDEIDSKWWRLGFLCILLAIAAGLSPAAASYVEFFSRSGVMSWVCQPGEKKCETQQAQLGQTILDAMSAAKSLEFYGALIYQQYGADMTLRLAGTLHLGGWLELLALNSFQLHWSGLCTLAIVTIDCSRGLIKYVPYAFLEEFPGQAATVLSWGNAGHNAAAMLALLFIFIVDVANVGLFGLGLIQVAFGLLLRIMGPKALPESQGEEPDKAGEQEEAPADTDKQEGSCSLIYQAWKETWVYLWPDKKRHIFVLAVLGVGPLWSAQYQAIAVAYGTLLFPTENAVHSLSSGITISSFIANCAFSPLAAIFLERFGLSALLLALSVLQISCLPLTPIASIITQSYIGFIAVLLFAVEPALLGLHLFAYVDVRWSGMAAAVWNLLFFQFYFWGMFVESRMFDHADKAAEKFEAYHATLIKVIHCGCYAYTSYAMLTFFFPPPDKPVIPPAKQVELCKPYACRNLHEVANVLNYPLDLAEQTVLQPALDKTSKAIIVNRTRVHAVREQLGHWAYDSISELVTSGQFIWNPQHENKKPSKGFMMAGVVMPAAKLEQAIRAQANVDSFGRGTSKSLGSLKQEMTQRKSVMIVDQDDPTKLLRVTTVAVLRISVHFQGQTYFLIEAGSEYADGLTKQHFRFPATKKNKDQSFQDAVSKVLDELGLTDMAAELVDKHSESSVESVESESYPGLLTRYVKRLADVSIVTNTDNPCLEEFGLSPRPMPWKRNESSDRAEENSRTAMKYEWLREDEIKDRMPGFLLHFPTKVQQGSKTPADIGLDLFTILRARGHVTQIIRNARNNDFPTLSEMLTYKESATNVQCLPYFLDDGHLSYYRDKILQVLKTMISEKKRPDKNVLIESLLIDLIVEKHGATDLLLLNGLI